MAKEVKVRLLVDAVIDDQPCKCNTVVAVSTAEAKRLVAQGVADDTAAAVEYAESLAPAADPAQ